MNHELLSLIRETGYLSDADLSPQQRFDLLTKKFWMAAGVLGYDILSLKRLLWRVSGRGELALIEALPEGKIEKSIKSLKGEKEKDNRKKILLIASELARTYREGERDIARAIDLYLDSPEVLRREALAIRRRMLSQAITWINSAIPNMYLSGSKARTLMGAHERTVRALAEQELNRFREIDATIGRHIEEVIAEFQTRKAQAELAGKTKIAFSDLKGKIVGRKTIDGKELSLSKYVRMLAITVSRDVLNLGVQNTILADGNDLARFNSRINPNTCAACANWAGRIVSISGHSRTYPALQEAKDDNVWHPHCIHYLIPLTEGEQKEAQK